MFNRHLIVPELAAAVSGVTEELSISSKSSSLELNRHSTSSSSSMSLNNSSNDLHIPSANLHLQGLSPVDVRKAFHDFDKNHDGKLSIKEFKSAMHNLGYKTVNKQAIRRIFAEANENRKSNTLTYSKFVQFVESRLLATKNNRTTVTNDVNSLLPSEIDVDIKVLFNCYDLDKNGYIEPKELRKVMKRLIGKKLSKQDIEEMMRVGDINGDGLLDKNEFALLCQAIC